MHPWRRRSVSSVIRTVLLLLVVVFAALPHPVNAACAKDCPSGASSAATCCVSGSHCPISDEGRAQRRCCCVSDRDVPALPADFLGSRTPTERGQADFGSGWVARAYLGSVDAILAARFRAASGRAADGPGTAPLYKLYESLLI
jgi:hypothetical protein